MEKTRPLWDNPLQFVFACISYAVGLGNVWRFPYLCQMYGGEETHSEMFKCLQLVLCNGRWLACGRDQCVLAVGRPARSRGRVGAALRDRVRKTRRMQRVKLQWELATAMAATCFRHFRQQKCELEVLPFLVYPPSADAPEGEDFMSDAELERKAHGVNVPAGSAAAGGRFTVRLPRERGHKVRTRKPSSPPFPLGCVYRRHWPLPSRPLNIAPSREASGGLQWEQALCLTLAWLVVYLCILRGTESTGKVVYLTASLPYCVLIIYLIRGLTLHGAVNGLVYMFTPKAVQGTGLAFIVYSEAIKNMEVSQLYSVLYFVMLLTLGIGSMLGNTAAILTPLTDSKFIATRLSKEVISGIVCVINCIIGLTFTMEAGNYWFDIFNDYAATLSLLLIVLVETIAVCYIYGIRRFEKDLHAMIGHKPSWYWKIMWAFASPLLIISLFIFYITDYILTGTLQYQAWDATQGQLVTKDYPSYALAVIGLLVAASTMCIPMGALITFISRRLKRENICMVA
nr:PREDICTED: sodium- and chloride-dependent transporter XTRP3 [Struthio camelus australis]